LSHIPSYPKQSIFEAFNLFRTKPYGQGFEVKDAYFKFFDAGHIPGSAYLLIETEGKRIVYTGDIKLNETQLLKGADLQVHDIDTLIMETTYGNREHSERKKTETEFLDKVEEVLKRGGSVFIASFAVGRTQELMLLLHTRNWDVPVYIDGLGRDITDLVIEHAACKDNQALIDARTKSSYINGRADRETALQGHGIFVASAGMMTGGAIIEYLKQCHQDPKNAFLLSGYVDDGTNGRMLLDEGSVFIEGRKTKVKAEYKQYDFSAHAGLSELQTLVKKINPRRVILLHGEDDALTEFADWLRKNNKDVYIPAVDSELNI
jgi:putative mRNA 3-end processing factor